MEQTFSFSVTPIDDALAPQLSRVLEKRTELESRRRLPALWRLWDWLHKMPKARPEILERRRKREAFLGLWVWAMSVFLMVPSVMEPSALLAPLVVSCGCFFVGCSAMWRIRRGLLAAVNLGLGVFLLLGALADRVQLGALLFPGFVCVAVGLAALASKRAGRRGSSFDRQAAALLRQRAEGPGMESVRIGFDADGMTVSDGTESPSVCIAYADLLFVGETEDLLVPVSGQKALVLQKKDLQEGKMDQLRELLRARTALEAVSPEKDGIESE